MAKKTDIHFAHTQQHTTASDHVTWLTADRLAMAFVLVIAINCYAWNDYLLAYEAKPIECVYNASQRSISSNSVLAEDMGIIGIYTNTFIGICVS